MLSLPAKFNKFKINIPNSFIPNDINKKWMKQLSKHKSTIKSPIDFLMESIRSVNFPGIQESHSEQRLIFNDSSKRFNKGIGLANSNQEGNKNPLEIINPRLDITLRHSFGFYNYWLLYEIWDDRYCDEKPNKDSWTLDMLDENDRILFTIRLDDPVFTSMDELALDYTTIERASNTFNISILFNNIDINF